MSLELFYLASCSTCQRIMKELKVQKYPFRLQDIKTEQITPGQLDRMKDLAGSYEQLFSRVALKYRALGLNQKKLSEKDYKKYILEEYTFLRRPVFIIGEKIFIGNAPSTVAEVAKELTALK